MFDTPSQGSPVRIFWDYENDGFGAGDFSICNETIVPGSCTAGGTPICVLAGPPTNQWTCTVTPSSHVYLDSTVPHTARLRVQTTIGSPLNQLFTVNVLNAPPNGYFVSTDVTCTEADPFCNSGSPATLREGGRLTFNPATAPTDSGADPIVRWEWHFGDGSPNLACTTAGPNPPACGGGASPFSATHTYAQQGPYSVEFVPCDEEPAGTFNCDLDLTESTATINVVDAEPTVGNIVSIPDPQAEGSSVTFSASITATSADRVVRCRWIFGDASEADDLVNCPVTGVPAANGTFLTSIAHTYSLPNDGNPDTFDVRLEVFDEDPGFTLAANDATFLQTINDVNPTIALIANGGPVSEGSPVTSTANITTGSLDGTSDNIVECYWDPDGPLPGGGLFGEQGPFAAGSPQCGGTPGSPNSAFTFTYPVQGVYPSTIRVVDEDSQSTTFTNVTVNDVSPSINGITNNGPVNEGSFALLSATILTGAADLTSDNIVSCTWDADGAGPLASQTFPFLTPQCGGTGAALNSVYQTPDYPQSGAQAATLQVNDEDSNTQASTSVSVTEVNPVIPTITSSTPNNEGDTTSISATFDSGAVNDALDEITQCTFDPDDGGPLPVQTFAFGVAPECFNTLADPETATINFVYPNQGTFTARFTVSDEDTSFSRTTAVVILDVRPSIANIANNGPISEGDVATLSADIADGSAQDLIDFCTWDQDGAGGAFAPQVFARGTPQCDPAVSGTAVFTTAVYPVNNTFVATLSVSDEDDIGGPQVASTSVVVLDVDPTVTMGGNNGPNDEATPTQIFATIADGSVNGLSDPISSCTWTPGDGTPAQTFLVGTAPCSIVGQSTFTHTYDDDTLAPYTATSFYPSKPLGS